MKPSTKNWQLELTGKFRLKFRMKAHLFNKGRNT